ncbi:MAG: tetratricopeptide repeat protein [Cyanobacteria bacterium J06638_6]
MNLMQLLSVKSKQTIGGRYKLLQPLGQGGFGHTFLATDLHLPDHPICVIKQLKPHLQDAESLKTARRLFETEARVLYQLGTHAQIPRLLAHFEEDQEFYLAQELIDGASLCDLIHPGRPWSEARARQLLSEILTPLAFVHEQGVIHRDLKPSNLIHRRGDDHIVLIDFGAVKQVSERRDSGEITRTISIGTQGYMPSEQLAGNPWFSSDIYAAGMICLQALTGTAPHLLKRDPQTSEVLWQSPDLDISDDFKAVLSRMVRYDYRERYANATEVLDALHSLPASDPGADANISSLPTEMVDPIKRSSSAMAAVDQKLIETEPLPTRAAKTLGQALTQSRQSRWSILGLSLLTVVALGLVRSTQTSANLTAQSPLDEPTTVVSPAAPSASNPETPISSTDAAALDASSDTAPATTTEPSPLASNATAPPAAAPPATVSPATASPNAVPPVPPSSAQPTIDDLLAEADELRDRNQYQAAIQVYDQLLERTPDISEAHWGQCYSFNQLQNYGLAVEACDRALAIAPDNSQALWSKGYALEQQSQPQAALALYDQTLALDPNHTQAWNNRGGILLQQQRFQEALEALDQARKLDPEFAEAWSNRGAALWELRQWDDAISSIETALKLQRQPSKLPHFTRYWETMLDRYSVWASNGQSSGGSVLVMPGLRGNRAAV